MAKDWQEKTITMLENLTEMSKMLALSGTAELSLETELKQVAQSLEGAGQMQRSVADTEMGMRTSVVHQRQEGSHRSAYREAQEMRRQSERLLQI